MILFFRYFLGFIYAVPIALVLTIPFSGRGAAALIVSVITHEKRGDADLIQTDSLGNKLFYPNALSELYKKSNEPLILAKTYTNAQRADMADMLAKSWEHGLNPETYRATFISESLKKQGAATAHDLDLLMLDSLARYIRDMTGMRIRAKDMDLRAADWRKPIEPDAALAALQAAPDPVAYLKSLAPQGHLYARLQAELAALKPVLESGRGGESIYPFAPIKKVIRPGDRNPSIADLRDRLGGKVPETGNADEYDDRLAQVVMDFQRNHGLKDDGVIGRQTIQFFNQTYFERFRQVVANLERMRWLDPVKPAKYIVVNIPAATLWAVENDKVVAEMPVIVGRKTRPTAQFKTNVIGVRFNPTWTVPETIKNEDFLPELLKNPDFLTDKGVEVWRGKGDDAVQIDPRDVDWTAVGEGDMASMRMVQPSGPHNSLGQIRIMMPNQYDIYLHDTNTPEYFRDDARSISSGCVRLSRPQEIAKFVLDGADGWSQEGLKDVLTSEKTKEYRANHPFPVFFLYQSAWLKKDGSLVMAYDIYEDDIRLYDALAADDLVPKFTK